MSRNTEFSFDDYYEDFSNFTQERFFGVFLNEDSQQAQMNLNNLQDPELPIGDDLFADDPLFLHNEDSKTDLFGNFSRRPSEMAEEFPIDPTFVRTLSAGHQENVQPMFSEIFLGPQKSQQSANEDSEVQILSNTDILLSPKPRSSQGSQPSTVERSEASNLNMEIENLIQPESSGSEKTKKNLPHLSNSRNPKGERNIYQKQCNGYWTNNLLRWAKKYHLDIIIKLMGPNWFKKNTRIYNIFNKINSEGEKSEAITLADYETLYSEPELEEVWEKFFSKKMLFRDLMLSKTKNVLKVVYSKFLRNFERAYRKKTFSYLTKIIKEDPNI